MTLPARSRRTVLPLVFIASFASLAYELSLIRVFSITLSYHFAFMVVSIAMLGIGASGTLLFVMPRLKDARKVPLYVLLLAFAVPASYLAAGRIPFDPARMSWDWLQLVYIGLFAVILSVPFLFFGLAVSTSYSVLTDSAGPIYAADLLGACAGSLALLVLLSAGGPERALFLLSMLASAAALFCGKRVVRYASVLVLGLDLLILLTQPAFIRPRMSPYKPLASALAYPDARTLETRYSPYARVDVFTSPAVRFAPGLSFTYLAPLPEQTGVAVDCGSISAISQAGDPSAMDFVDHLPSALPYVLTLPRNALVLGPRGGLSLRLAIRSGARDIVTIESNPLLQKVVGKLDRVAIPTGVELRSLTGLGRSRIAAMKDSFDIIDLSFSGSSTGGSLGLSEDYSTTVEAFRAYLKRLSGSGIVSLDLFLRPPARSELRILATLLQAAEELGVADAGSRIAAIRSWDTVTVLYRNRPLTGKDIAAIKRFCALNRFDTVYYPGMSPEEGNRYVRMRDNGYSEAFRSIIRKETRSTFIKNYLFDIRPVRDEAPFGHYYLKRENVRNIYRTMGRKWQYLFEEGYLLPFLLLQTLVVSIAILLLPLIGRRRSPGTMGARRLLVTLPYFGALGLGYLFLEVSFMQIMMLPLEFPAYAAATVLASVLAGSGIGGYLSRNWQPRSRRYSLLWLAGDVLLYSLALPPLSVVLAAIPLAVRIAACFVLFLPVGLLMGIPLPLGLSLLGKRDADLIPWAWAMNGCSSVVAPLLAMLIALSTGFAVVLLCGAGLYAAGFFLLRDMAGEPAG